MSSDQSKFLAVSNYPNFGVVIINPATGNLEHAFYLEKNMLAGPSLSFSKITALAVKADSSDNIYIVAKSNPFYMLIKFNINNGLNQNDVYVNVFDLPTSHGKFMFWKGIEPKSLQFDQFYVTGQYE